MGNSLHSSRGSLRDHSQGLAAGSVSRDSIRVKAAQSTVNDDARGVTAQPAARDLTRGLAAQLARYTVDARAQNFSPKTVDKMQLGLRLFDEFMGGVADVRRIEGDDLRRFIVDVQQRTRWQGTQQASRGRLADETTRTYAQAVKVFWGWMASKGAIARNPLAEVALPRVGRKLPRTFNEAEVKAVMAAADSLRARALVWLLLDSGARLSEVTGGDRYPGICLEDIDLRTGAIKVRGKFQLERQVHISPATIEVVRHYLEHERPQPAGPDNLFLSENGRPLIAARVQKVLEAIGRKAGLKHRLSAHKLRHTHAVLSLKYGSNVEYQRRELGHRHISTTQGYLAICDDDLARAHRSFSPVTNLLSGERRGGR